MNTCVPCCDVPSVVKYVLVPCRMDDKGKAEATGRPPYGYYHDILKVYADGSWCIVATVDVSEGGDKIAAVAQILAGELPVEIDREFYEKSPYT